MELWPIRLLLGLRSLYVEQTHVSQSRMLITMLLPPPPTFPRSPQAATRHAVLASSGAGAGNVCAVCNTKALFFLLVPKETMSTAAYTVA